jgi:uncharacterized RDD family membrane protein YckC
MSTQFTARILAARERSQDAPEAWENGNPDLRIAWRERLVVHRSDDSARDVQTGTNAPPEQGGHAPGSRTHPRAPVPLWPPPPPPGAPEGMAPGIPPTPDPQPGYFPPGQFPPQQPGALGGMFTRGASAAPVDSLGRPLASWLKRALALAVDFFILSLFLSWFDREFFPQVVNATNLHVVPSHEILQFFGVTVVLWIAYLSLLGSSRRGQTLGMMLYGIAVRDDRDGGQVRVGRAALRSTILIVLFGFLFDLLWPLWDTRRQSIHDKAARTVVVDVRLAAFLQQVKEFNR